MKTRYLLFLTSCLCGIALSFAYVTYGHPFDSDDPAHTSTASPNPDSTSTLTDQAAFNIATRLVSDRDAALLAQNRQALQALTVPDSPARQIDEALFDRLEELSSLNTVVLDVHVLTENEWEVRSIQQEIRMSDGRTGSGEERCTLWHVEKNPWRLYETCECE